MRRLFILTRSHKRTTELARQISSIWLQQHHSLEVVHLVGRARNDRTDTLTRALRLQSGKRPSNYTVVPIVYPLKVNLAGPFSVVRWLFFVTGLVRSAVLDNQVEFYAPHEAYLRHFFAALRFGYAGTDVFMVLDDDNRLRPGAFAALEATFTTEPAAAFWQVDIGNRLVPAKASLTAIGHNNVDMNGFAWNGWLTPAVDRVVEPYTRSDARIAATLLKTARRKDFLSKPLTATPHANTAGFRIPGTKIKLGKPSWVARFVSRTGCHPGSQGCHPERSEGSLFSPVPETRAQSPEPGQ